MAKPAQRLYKLLPQPFEIAFVPTEKPLEAPARFCKGESTIAVGASENLLRSPAKGVL